MMSIFYCKSLLSRFYYMSLSINFSWFIDNNSLLISIILRDWSIYS
nr:MAG TPA: hypothetical protein [Caudoviricetes sp.]